MSAKTHDELHAIVTDLALLVGGLDKRMSHFVAELRGMAANDVLDVEVATIGPAGTFSRDWTVPYAAVSIINFTGGVVTVTSDTPGSAAPTGPGCHQVGAGAAATINLMGRTLTLYGTVGGLVSLQVFTRPQPPAYGPAGGGTSGAIRLAENSALLLAGVTVNGTTRATGGFSKFRAFGASDVAGTLNVQQSRDGVTWYTTVTQPVAAGITSGTIVESILELPFARAQFVNGAANQGAFELDSALIAI
jgi:hypothetical protein